MDTANILVSINEAKKIGIVTLNRPKELNALSYDFLNEINVALHALDKNEKVNCMILTGSVKAFAAGADIKALAEQSPLGIWKMDMYGLWQNLKNLKKPVIAAVAGFALGGGCELAMLCDIIIAAENAQFGQPEIKLGIMPGAGGTQRLPKLVGKHKAMEMVLTGNFINAAEAYRIGMINKVVPTEMLMLEAEKTASLIASHSTVAVQLAKESILKSLEMGLNDGLAFERRNYMACFDTPEQKEKMKAFLEK
ncbi:MAG: enoyl-CoA hydratase-related protein [Bacteroidia bacterium]